MTGTGLTVSTGTRPERFQARVLGVETNGIAPGIDMILIEASSPALQKAGGVWAGMSGSPVYADDGRLMGAVSHSMSVGPSFVAGLTPTSAMLEVLNLGPARAGSVRRPQQVPLQKALQGEMVQRGDASPAQAAGGMSELPIPLGISGLQEGRLRALQQQLSRSGLRSAAVYPTASAGLTAPARPGDLSPGGNFAAAIAYGDVTAAGVATTTMVCGAKVLAFGHPYALVGEATFSAHVANALAVNPDPTFGPAKLANVGGVVGVVDEDRPAAVRATLGPAPSGIAVNSTVAAPSTGLRQDLHTRVNSDRFLPDVGPAHLLANADRVFQKIGEGSALVGWKVTGTDRAGQPWTLTHTNRYVSPADIANELPLELTKQLQALEQNRFEEIRVRSLDVTATVDDVLRQYTIDQVQAQDSAGSWVTLGPQTPAISVASGSPLQLRVLLTPYKGRGLTRTEEVSVQVPGGLEGRTGALVVQGGRALAGADLPASTSFRQLLSVLAEQPRNDIVRATLSIDPSGNAGPVQLVQSRQLDQAVAGTVTVPVAVAAAPARKTQK